MAKKLLGVLTALAAVAIAGVALAEVPAACTGITFTRNLAQGMSGADVKCLQALLNQDPATKVAETGPGSPGYETTYFGPLTKAAVVKFQEKYAADILTPLGLTAGTGYVGPLTRAKLNSLLTAAPAPTPTPTPTPTPAPTGEEGTLKAEDVPLPAAVTLYEGDTNVGVMAFKLSAKGSAVTVQRIDVVFTSRPYGCLTYVSLYDGANPIVGREATKDNFTYSDGKWTMRFSGLSLVVPKDGSKTITVKVSAAPMYPSGCTTTNSVYVPVEGVRGVDGIGINVYAPKDTALLGKSFTYAPIQQGTVSASLSATTPAEGVAIIDTKTRTEVELAKFDLKASNSDVTIDTVNVSLTGKEYLVALRLYDGTDLIAEKSAADTVIFDDLLVSIAKDTTKTLTVKGLAEVSNSIKVGDVAVTLTSVSGTDVNENPVSWDVNISANTIHLYTVAPIISNITASAEAKDLNNSGGPEAIVGKITFSVTAKGGDVWISTSTKDLAVQAIKSDGATSPVSESDVVLTTSATAGKWGYKVPKDQTISFTVDATKSFTSSSDSGYWKLAITQLVWNVDDASTTAQTWTGWAVKDLVTGYVYLTGQ
jgi:peptidoglycan hydrolase-like protein with peptidoglycan-binding domain